MVFKGDTMPIGIYSDEEESFTNERIELQQGDALYMFSDGYVDQIGGPRGKTFRSKYFKELLLSISEMKMVDQYKTLEQTIEEWRGEKEQIDDILVMGLRV